MISENEYNKEDQLASTSIIVFKVDGEEFAIDLLNAREIIKQGQIRRLPQTSEFIEGIYNYRGDIIHIINLSKKLELHKYKNYLSKVEEETTDSEEKHIIIVSINGVNTGVLVDQIKNISHLKAKVIVELNPLLKASNKLEYIKGIAKFKDRPRLILDLNKILTEAEQAKLQQDVSNQ